MLPEAFTEFKGLYYALERVLYLGLEIGDTALCAKVTGHSSSVESKERFSLVEKVVKEPSKD